MSGNMRYLSGLSVIDAFAPDKAAELRGRLVFICGALRETLSSAVFSRLTDAGAAALLLAGNGESVPAAYGKIADRYGLPLITVNHDPFSSGFISDFASFLWGIPNADLNILQNTDISAELIDSPNVMTLMERLEDYLGIPSAYRDILLNRTMTASRDKNFTEMVKTYPLRELQRIFDYQWVVAEGVRVGCLLFSRTVKHEYSGVLNSALLGLRIHLKKGNQQRIARKKILSDFFSAVIEEGVQDTAVFMEKLKSAGIRRDSDCLAVAIKAKESILMDYNDFKFMMGIEAIERRISSLFENAFVMLCKDTIMCVIMPAGGQRREYIMERVLSAVSLAVHEMRGMYWPECHIGCGGMKNSLASLGDSVSEAMRAVQYSQIYEIEEGPVFWDDLDSYQIISTVALYPEAKKLYSRVLGSLLRYDKEHNGELMYTLISLERNNWNVRLTAKEMSFHPNTIKYRLRKISELLDGDMAEPRFKFDLSMGLRLHSIYKFNRDIQTEGELNDV